VTNGHMHISYNDLSEGDIGEGVTLLFYVIEPISETPPPKLKGLRYGGKVLTVRVFPWLVLWDKGPRNRMLVAGMS
jgi:hypothetical protein